MYYFWSSLALCRKLFWLKLYKNKVQERTKIFNEMKRLQLGKLNRATYNLLLDVSPMVDQETNVLQHFLASELVSLGNSTSCLITLWLLLILVKVLLYRTLGQRHGEKYAGQWDKLWGSRVRVRTAPVSDGYGGSSKGHEGRVWSLLQDVQVQQNTTKVRVV